MPETNNPVYEDFSNDDSFPYDSGTGSGRVLVVSIAIDQGNRSVVGITYDGAALAKAQRSVHSGGPCEEIWYLESPAEGENTLAINMSGSGDYSGVFLYVSGADPLGGIGASAINDGDSNDFNVDITPTRLDSLLVAGFSTDGNAHLVETGGSSEIIVAGTDPGTGLFSKVSAALEETNVAASGSSDQWACVALEILPPSSDVPPPFPLGFMVRKRLGKPGWPDPLNVFGVWQMRMTKRGKVPIKMKFYVPTNPQTVPQQANRQKFADAMSAWQSLTDEQKSDYNKRAKKRGMFGRNLYIREYYQST